MGSGIFFPLCALLFSFLLVIIFFTKKHIKTFETKLYGFLILSNFVALNVELLCTYAALIYNNNKFLADIILKSYLACILTWAFVFTMYIFYISHPEKYFENKRKKLFNFCIIFYIIMIVINYFLPIELVIKNNFEVRYTVGAAVNFTYGISSVFIGIMIFQIIKNFKMIKSKKYLPLIVFLTVGSLGMIYQALNPGILLMTYMETFVTYIMYHTIENPDIRVIEELKKNKELIEKTTLEKANFLFKVSQEVREPIEEIKKINKENIENNNLKEIHVNSNKIDLKTRQLSYVVNNVLDVSNIDAKKLNVVKKEKYDIHKLLNEINLRTRKKVNENIDFRFTSSENIPKYLFGDSIKLKQVIMTIIENAIEKTKAGFIEINVHSIVKYDVCRLIISIEDSGTGIPLDKVNELLDATGELTLNDEQKLNEMNLNFKLANKIIRLLGGTIMIKSDEGKGSEFTIVLDQLISAEENDFKKSMLKYSENIENKINILLVSDNKGILKTLEDSFGYYNTTTVMDGNDSIKRIQSGEKYNLIIVDDDMKPIGGINILNELKKDSNFDIPVIILLSNSKKTIKQHYLKDGFCDYIFKENIKKESERIIKKML